MHKPLISLTIAAIVFITLFSCTPGHDTATRDLIAGDWKMTYNIDDYNTNGIIDSSEIAAGIISPGPVYTFVSSGSGYVTLFGVHSSDFSWELTDNTTMKIAGTATPSTVVTVKIENLTATDMTLKKTDSGLTSWEIFKKK